jgi:hypothetical protein
VRDVAVPLRPLKVPKGPFATAIKVVMVTASTYTVCPLSTENIPVKPESMKPSLIVGSGPVN